MQRRTLCKAALGLGVTVAAAPLWAQPGSVLAVTEDVNYRRLSHPAPVDAPAGRIEVLEFFSYACIHCSRFVAPLRAWKRALPADVQVRHVPVRFGPEFEPLQRLYFTLNAMGAVESHHERVFQAIHQRGTRLNTNAAVFQWAQGAGLDRAQFERTFNSFGVGSRLQRANRLQKAYQVRGTPSLGIAGRFYVPGQGERTLKVADVLLDRVRRG